MSDDATEGAEVRSPRRWIASLVLLAFLAGAGAGGLAMHGIEALATTTPASAPKPPQHPHNPGNRPPHGNGGGGGGGPMANMVRELALDADTEQKVKEIFESRRGQFEEVFKTIKPQMDKVRADTRAAVRAALPADKQAGFDKLMAEEDARPPGGREGHGRRERGDGAHRGDEPPPPPSQK